MDNERLIKSYVWHGEQCFFVSTINRSSSALGFSDHRYAETLVWLFDWDKNERLGMLGHGESVGEGSIRGHIATCTNLRRYGTLEEPEEETDRTTAL